MLFIVDADPQTRVVVQSALARRFGPDYRVLAVGGPQDALTALKRLVVGLSPRGDDRVMALGDGSEAAARAVIITAGVAYRRLGIPALDRLIGAGVFYGAPGVEAPAMAGRQVCVVGGANSAGQAALHLAKFSPGSVHEYLTELAGTGKL